MSFEASTQDTEFLRKLFDEFLFNFIAQRYSLEDNPINEAITYSLQGAGKKTRPLMCMLSALCLKADPKYALRGALAIEMIHTYSLIHDDLPCMDNDDLRRGRATPHKLFGENCALLAGDALLTDAFAVLADSNWVPTGACTFHSAEIALQCVRELSLCCGSRGMVAGQMLDIVWTGKPDAKLSILDAIHLNKTAKLFSAACAIGALSARASQREVSVLRDFGLHIGLAFQIVDDLLDELPGLGKTPGKDKKYDKLTYPKLVGMDAAKKKVGELTEKAMDSLQIFGENSQLLTQFVDRLVVRDF